MVLNRQVLMVIGGVGVVIAALSVGYLAGRGKPSAGRPAAVVSTATATPSDEAATALLTTAEQSLAHDQWFEARTILQRVVNEYPETPAAIEAQQRLGDVNIHLLFAPSPNPGTPFYTTYVVQPGDTLGAIAQRSRTSVELLQKANHLTGDKILVGRPLKVPRVTFSVVVDKSQNLLTLKANEEVIKVYTVSTGKEDQTPVGTFTIVNKLVDPPWYSAQGVIPAGSPQNILGTRWMGFSKPSYGIHGTTDPSTIGQSVTAGCVRMRNAEVEELYALLPVGTDVTIVD